MARAGRKRTDNAARETNGRLQRLSKEGREAAEALAPATLAILRQNLIRDAQNELWGSQIGIMNLRGEIGLPQLEAGKRWRNLARKYQSALGVKGIKPISFERVGASCDYDPDSAEGRKLSDFEKRHCKDFEDALGCLVDAGRQSLYAVRLLCEEDHPLSWAQKQDAKCGLSALVIHWGLTGPNGNVRNKT